jgi:hypothetical protein
MATSILRKKKFIIDTKTKNISFIQTAKDLHVLGIKECYFFLKLYDHSLQGVDPHNPLLPEDMIMRIINECMINPWYFLRECVRIPDQGGNGVGYILHRANLAFTWCFLNGLQSYTVIPRQTFKTQSTLAIILWAFLFGTTNSEFMFNNKEQEDANMNLDRLKKQRDLLPPYLQFKLSFEEGKLVKGTDNVKSLTNENNKNKIVTKPKATSKEKAESIGRGASQPIQMFDEVEFTNHIKTIIQASGPAYKSAAHNAKRNKAIHGRLFLTTPGNLDTLACKQALTIIEGACKWTELFYTWTKEEIDEYIRKNSTNAIIYIEYQYMQLGFDEEWFRETCKSVLNDPLEIKREIFLKRIRGSSMSPFEQEDLEAIEELKGQVKQEIFINKYYRLDIYTELERGKIYIVGVDVGEGVGQDNTSITIINPYNEKPVAEFKCPYIGTEDIKKFLYILVKKYIPRAILCIERNHVGGAVIQGLKEMGLNANLYFDNTKDLTGDVDDRIDPHGFLKKQAFNRRLYGVFTGQSTRPIMMKILASRIKQHKDKFICAYLISDIMNLVKTATGKVAASTGQNDDNVMSYLIGMYVLIHGNNLERYGFIPGEVEEGEENKGLVVDPNEVLQYLSEEMREAYAYLQYDQDAETLDYYKEVNRCKSIDNSAVASSSYVLVSENDEYDGGDSIANLCDELND